MKLILFLFFLTTINLTTSALSVVDAAGETLSLSAPPRRIVSLMPAATEILYALGAGDEVVGVTEYCDYPEEAKQKPKIGAFSGAAISVERIAALKPDLVVASLDMHFRITPLLQRLGIPVYRIEPRSFAEIYKTIENMGLITGQEKEAAAIISQMKEKIAEAARIQGGKAAQSVYWEVDSNPLFTAGGGSFISEAIALAGGRNIFAVLSASYPQVSVEQILALNPDWLLAPSDHSGAFDADSLSHRPGWGSLSAVRQNRIAKIEANLINRYGPRLADAVVCIAEVLARR